MSGEIKTVIADYLNAGHAGDIGHLLNSYAADPMGGGVPLAEGIQSRIATELARIPGAFTVLCYVDSQPAGLANCFTGFSTFKCRPLVNIHDIAVLKEFRGLGISQLLLDRVELLAQEKGCCKITLEVLEGNHIARNAYLKFGFAGYELDPQMGKALFWEKVL